MAIKTFTNDKWVVAKIESFEDAKKYATGTKWGIAQEQKFWDSHSKDGDIFFIKNKTDKVMFAYQPATKLLADQNDAIVDVEKFFTDNPVIKDAFNDAKTELDQSGTETPAETVPKAVETTPEQKPPTNESLDDIYKNMLAEKHGKNTPTYDITTSTHKLISKSPPRGKFVTGLEQELFDIDPELMQQLPMKSVELFQHALVNLLSIAKDEPKLMQSLRQIIRRQVKAAEEEVIGEPTEDQKNESTIASFKDTMNEIITEAKANRFNYKVLLDIDPNKINDPQFILLLNSFDLLGLSRMQKQGVLILLKKLAEIADVNPQIAMALTRIVRLEATKKEPVQESIQEIHEMLTEAFATTTLSATDKVDLKAAIEKELGDTILLSSTPTALQLSAITTKAKSKDKLAKIVDILKSYKIQLPDKIDAQSKHMKM
jgi:hypothetical protein